MSKAKIRACVKPFHRTKPPNTENKTEHFLFVPIIDANESLRLGPQNFRHVRRTRPQWVRKKRLAFAADRVSLVENGPGDWQPVG
jgi:hypothetical protein